ncbi:MAG: hypothetical protein ACXWW4_16755 [Candidatus Binatia bacterium]|nr:hypothetical protein [Candidatus Deferrimicrobium sp.]
MIFAIREMARRRYELDAQVVCIDGGFIDELIGNSSEGTAF